MTKFGVLGAAAILASALASPAMAQDASYSPGRCAQYDVMGNCIGPSHSYQSRAAYRRSAARNSYNAYGYNDDPRYRRGSGFWPADAAAGVAGAAVGTAAAVATAPFRALDNSYAYNRAGPGYYGDWNTYAAQNGIVCRPGTYFKGEDGLRHLCQ
jgi:hypothetical protein